MSMEGVKSNSAEAANNRAKREAKEKEEALIKKHQAELARLNRQHKAQVQALQNSYETSTDALKRNTQESLSQKDQEYQRDIEEMREMHRQSYRKAINEKDQQYDALRRTSSEELDRQKERSESQTTNLRETFENELSRSKKEFNSGMDYARKEMVESIQRERAAQNQAHESDKKIMRDNRNREVTGLQESFRRMRSTKDSEIKDLKAEVDITKTSLGEKFEDEVDRIESTYQTRSSDQKAAFDNSLQEMRDDNKQAQLDRDEQFVQSYRDLKNEARLRHTAEVQRLERKIADLKHQSQESLYGQKRLSQMEKKALMEAIGENIKALESAQAKARDINNAKTAEEIRAIQRRNDETMSAQREFFRDKINTQQMIFDDAYKQQTGELQATIRNKETIAKSQDQKTRALYASELKEADDRLRQTIQIMKREYEEEMKDMKLKLQSEKNDTIVANQNMMREAETKYNARMADTIRKYEDRVSELASKAREAQIEEKVRSERLLKDNAKQAEMRLKAQAMQYEAKMAQLKEQQERAVGNLKQQLEQQRLEVATRAPDSGKKV